LWHNARLATTLPQPVKKDHSFWVRKLKTLRIGERHGASKEQQRDAADVTRDYGLVREHVFSNLRTFNLTEGHSFFNPVDPMHLFGHIGIQSVRMIQGNYKKGVINLMNGKVFMVSPQAFNTFFQRIETLRGPRMASVNALISIFRKGSTTHTNTRQMVTAIASGIIPAALFGLPGVDPFVFVFFKSITALCRNHLAESFDRKEVDQLFRDSLRALIVMERTVLVGQEFSLQFHILLVHLWEQILTHGPHIDHWNFLLEHMFQVLRAGMHNLNQTAEKSSLYAYSVRYLVDAARIVDKIVNSLAAATIGETIRCGLVVNGVKLTTRLPDAVATPRDMERLHWWYLVRGGPHRVRRLFERFLSTYSSDDFESMMYSDIIEAYEVCCMTFMRCALRCCSVR
jgi:hypothetical protein